MSLIKFIQRLFISSEKETTKPLKIIKDLDYLDPIWVKENGIIYEGWVFDITRRCIIVLYGSDLRDFRFRIDKNMDKTELSQDDKILYCNMPEEPYIKMIIN